MDEAWEGRKQSVTREEELRLEQVYSRGLGPYFLTGTNHQAVVEGRAPRHRGVEMGRVVRVAPDRVEIETGEAHQIAPLKPGDGVVFDAADWRSPGEPEEGGRVYEALPGLDGTLALKFGNGAIQFDRIRVGDLRVANGGSGISEDRETVSGAGVAGGAAGRARESEGARRDRDW